MRALSLMLPAAALLLLFCCHATVVDESDPATYCLDKEEIAAKLASPVRAKKRLTRVTNPSTASTEFRRNMPIVQGDDEEYPRFQSYHSSSCDTLCFHSDDSTKNDPFVELEFVSMNDGHHPYDKVMKMAADDSPYLMTTLREPVDYTMTLYKRRSFWDAPTPDIKDMTFEQWKKQVPWRTNQFTRLMGRQDGDTRVVKTIVDPTVTDELRDDVYMTQQNELGAESEILETAWQRLSQELHWFGLFHRLPESMELLGYTFCANVEKLKEVYTRPAPPQNHVDMLKSSLVGDLTEEEEEALVQEILQRNQLDAILFERAESLFDERLEEMREAKASGILCKFGGTVKVTCAAAGGVSGEGAREEL